VAVDGMLAPLKFQPGMSKTLEGPGYRQVMLSFADMTFGEGLPDEVARSIKAVIAAMPQEAAVGTARAMEDPAAWESDPIKVPVQMILSGAPIWPADYKQQVGKIAPELEFRKLKGTGHCLMLEKPEAFNALLRDFLVRQHALAPPERGAGDAGRAER